MTIFDVANSLLADRSKRFRRHSWPSGWFFGSDGILIVDQTGRCPTIAVVELTFDDWEEVDA